MAPGSVVLYLAFDAGNVIRRGKIRFCGVVMAAGSVMRRP